MAGPLPHEAMGYHHSNPPTLATPPRLRREVVVGPRWVGLQVWLQLRPPAPAHLHLALQLPGLVLREAPPAPGLRGHRQADPPRTAPRGWALAPPAVSTVTGEGGAGQAGRGRGGHV